MGIDKLLVVLYKYNGQSNLRSIKLIFESPSKPDASLTNELKVFRLSVIPEYLVKLRKATYNYDEK